MVDSNHTPRSEGTVPEGTGKPAVGDLAVDTARQRMGRVMGHEGPYIQLRPPAGGREWDVSPEFVRPAREEEILRFSVEEISLAAERRTP